MNEREDINETQRWRLRIGLIILVIGLLVYLFGINPGMIGLDRSPVIGFVQIGVFLVGIGLVCLGGYTAINTLWNGGQKSITADIGMRLVATGFVICIAAGMADVFGIGNQFYPVTVPHFGRWQAVGVIVGLIVIIIGFLLLIPYPKRKVAPSQIII